MKAKPTQLTIRAKRQRMKRRLVPFEPSLMFKYDPPSSSSESDSEAPDASPIPNQPNDSSDSDIEPTTFNEYIHYLDQTRREIFAIEHNLH